MADVKQAFFRRGDLIYIGFGIAGVRSESLSAIQSCHTTYLASFVKHTLRHCLLRELHSSPDATYVVFDSLACSLNSRQSLAAHGAGMSDDTNPFGFGNTAVLQVSCSRGGSQVHAPQVSRSARMPGVQSMQFDDMPFPFSAASPFANRRDICDRTQGALALRRLSPTRRGDREQNRLSAFGGRFSVLWSCCR